MSKNWRYVIKNSDGDIIKGMIYNTDQIATEVAWALESQGYEVLEISCLASFPFMKFLLPEKKNLKTYACAN